MKLKIKAMTAICVAGTLFAMLWGCEKTDRTVAPAVSAVTVKDIRELAASGTVLLPDGFRIEAVVTSNPEIEEADLVYVQDTNSGAAVRIRFDGTHNFRPGDRLELYPAGRTVQQAGREYEITGLPLIYTNRLGAATVEPRVTTAAEATANFDAWSSSVLQLDAMKVIQRLGNGTYVLQDSLGSATIIASVDERLNVNLPDSVQSITGLLIGAGSNTGLRVRTAADVITYSPQTGERTILETFDVGGQGTYANGDVVFTGFVSGDWMFNDSSVLGPEEVNDLRNGTGTVRLRGQETGNRVGYIHTLFDVPGLQRIRFLFGGANLGEGGAEVEEYAVEALISKDGGTTWESLGKKVGKRGEFTLMEYEVDAGPEENIRVKIQNASAIRSNGNRIRANVDDVALIY